MKLINVYGDTVILVDVRGNEHWIDRPNIRLLQKSQHNSKHTEVTWFDHVGNEKKVLVNVMLDDAKRILS